MCFVVYSNSYRCPLPKKSEKKLRELRDPKVGHRGDEYQVLLACSQLRPSPSKGP